MEANEKKTGGTLKKNPSVLTSGILKVLKYLFLIVIIVISIGPIVWAFLSSFKTYAEINASALKMCIRDRSYGGKRPRRPALHAG